MGLFCKRICCQASSKVAQSGHSVTDTAASVTAAAPTNLKFTDRKFQQIFGYKIFIEEREIILKILRLILLKSTNLNLFGMQKMAKTNAKMPRFRCNVNEPSTN